MNMINEIKTDKLLNILSLEDSIPDFEIIREKLIKSGMAFTIFLVQNENEYRHALQNNSYDIILADFKMPSFDAFDALKMCMEICPHIPFICVSGHIVEETAVELIKQGAADYILKDRLIRLPIAIQQALEKAQEKVMNESLTFKLQYNEQIFSAFMEHIPIYVFFKDENIRTIRLSKNYETMLGKPMHELIGKNMNDLFPSELAKKMVADDMRILKEGRMETIEEEFNGRFYTTIKFPIYIEGKPKYLSGYTIDITESKLNEKLLNEKMEEMLNFHRLSVGRELKMIELKKEINKLLEKAGGESKYVIHE